MKHLLTTLFLPLLLTVSIAAADPPNPHFMSTLCKGNDAADGLSPTTAWRTWAGFEAKASKGDSLLLKRGHIYDLPIPLVAGSPDAPVIYGDYGDSEKTILQGQVIPVSETTAWIHVGDQVWRTQKDMLDVANVIFNDSACGNKRYALAALKQAGEWHQAADGKGPLILL